MIKYVRHLLSESVAWTLACSLISSRLDYCNLLLHWAPESTIKKLQWAQNNATHVVLAVNRRSDAKPFLRQLHWFPGRQRVLYKIAVLMLMSWCTSTSVWFCTSLSALHVLLHCLCWLPKLITDFSRRSFSYSAPITWNSLPSNVSRCNSDSVFKKHLKTFLFNAAWLIVAPHIGAIWIWLVLVLVKC